MDKGGYEGWRVKIHDTFHQDRKSTWDATNLDVGGFSPPGQAPKVGPADIPFKNLAQDLRGIPQGHDALDLTRMIAHCVQNPHEPWFYPRDYDRLLQLIGCAATARQEHTDGEAFKRWTGINPPPPQGTPANATPVADQKETGDRRKRSSNMAGEVQVSGRQNEIGSPSNGRDSVSGTKQKGKEPKGRLGKKVRIDEEPVFHNMFEQKEEAEEHNSRASKGITGPEYVAPPEDSVVPLEGVLARTDGEINLAFAKQGQVGETDPYSAYAFGGPRHAPPYRRLYQIDLPGPADVSGWAENLRWAFEQNTLFRYPYRPDAWNESSEHMERIVQIRNDQYWMSEEPMAADEEFMAADEEFMAADQEFMAEYQN